MAKRDDDGEDRSEEEADEEEREEEEDEEREDEEEENEEEEDEEEEKPSSKAKAEPRNARRDARQKPREQAKPALSSGTVRAIALALLALVAGGAAGWFGRDAQAKAKLRAESGPAAAGSSGPCNAWQKKICGASGEQSATCGQAKGATELLTPGVCEAALESVPATLAKAKAARAPCDNLVSKLCKDLPPGSQACELVKDKTPSFPPDRCKEMLEHYDEVIGQLRMMDQQPGMGMGHPQGGPPSGAMPAPPH